jgi:hypothetical protein
MMIIKWTFIKEKTSKKEEKHMGSQKQCGWNRRPEQLSSLFLLAQNFQFYNSISTVPFVLFLSVKSYHVLPQRLVCVYPVIMKVWSQYYSVYMNRQLAWKHSRQLVSQWTTPNNLLVINCADTPLILPTGQSKQSNCLWHTLWPNYTDCRKVTCMALRGLPFGTMVIPLSVEVWQVVEEKKWGATSGDTDMMDIS